MDFVVSTGLDVIPVEVKYTRLSSVQTSRSFKSFLDKYKPEKAYVVHLGEKMEETFDTTKIVFLPFYESADYTGPYKLHSTHRLNYNSLYEQKCTKNTCTSI